MAVNRIEIRDRYISADLSVKSFFIDGRPLSAYIDEWTAPPNDVSVSISPTEDLAICWTADYDFKGDADFMRFVLGRQRYRSISRELMRRARKAARWE